jgi:hypothetical protein
MDLTPDQDSRIIADLLGIPIIESPWLPEDTVLLTGRDWPGGPLLIRYAPPRRRPWWRRLLDRLSRWFLLPRTRRGGQ